MCCGMCIGVLKVSVDGQEVLVYLSDEKMYDVEE